jgi:CRISPR-associated endonuclease Csn1
MGTHTQKEKRGLTWVLKNKGKKSETLIPLSKVLRVNQMALFYENSPEELRSLSKNELNKRLYKITQFEGDGRIKLRHHAQGGMDKDLNEEASLNFDKPAQKLRIRISNIQAIYEGRDFVLHPSGRVEFSF